MRPIAIYDAMKDGGVFSRAIVGVLSKIENQYIVGIGIL